MNTNPTLPQASQFSVNSSCVPAFRPLLPGVEASACERRASVPQAASLVWMSVHGKSGNDTGSTETPKPETACPRFHSCFYQAFAL